MACTPQPIITKINSKLYGDNYMCMNVVPYILDTSLPIQMPLVGEIYERHIMYVYISDF